MVRDTLTQALSQRSIMNNLNKHSSIRILHVIPTLGRGGAERQLVNLVSNTDRARFEHMVAFLRRPDDFAAEIEAQGYKTIRLDASGKTQWIRAAKRLRRVIEMEKPTVLHSWLYDANVSTRLAGLVSPSIPVIVSLQNADYESANLIAADLPRVKVKVLKLLDQISSRLTGPHFVACSEFVKKSTLEHLKVPPSSIEVIYNSVDPERLSTTDSEVVELRQSLAIPPEAFVFLNIGRLDPQKGQSVLVRAFHRVAAAIPLAYLLFVGQGPMKTELRQLSTGFGISDRVMFLGNRPDVAAFLALSDVFVFPSFFEGLPLALIEAMSKGLPCIVSSIDTLREVAHDQDSGLLVTPGSEDELANAMLRLYDDPAVRKRLGDRAKLEIKRKFHIGVTIGQWEKLYSRVVSNSQSISSTF